MARDPFLLRWTRSVLRLTGRVVPGEMRERWLQEWVAEFSHQWLSGSHLSLLRTLILLRWAFLDAVYLRRMARDRPNRHPTRGISVTPSIPGVTTVLTEIWSDLRVGFRVHRKAPFLSAVSVSALGLGIGITVAMFGVLTTVRNRALPFDQADQLVVCRSTEDGELGLFVSGPDYADYRDQVGAFRSLAALLLYEFPLTVTGGPEAERVIGTTVSPNLFSTLRARPQLGRGFSEGEGEAGGPNAVVISHGFWQRRFGGDPEVLGKSVDINSIPRTVVGVMPSDFHFLTGAEVWLPMRPDENFASERRFRNWVVLGRVRDGVGLEEAQSQVDVVAANLSRSYPDTNAQRGLVLSGLQGFVLEDYRARLLILSGAVVLVLVVALANVVGLMLSRIPARREELSVRTALGAGIGRLVRQSLSENLLFGLGGGAIGIALAMALQPVILGRLQLDRFGLFGSDSTSAMAVFAVVLSLMVSVLIGVLPALRLFRKDLASALRVMGRQAGTMAGRTGFQSGLVVFQVSLSIVLLTAAGLLLKSLDRMNSVDLGFSTGGIVTFEMEAPLSRFPNSEARTGLAKRIAGELASIPGVDRVGLTTNLPIRTPGNMAPVRAPGDEGEGEMALVRGVLPGYFRTMGIPLLTGRDFQDGEGEQSFSMLDAYVENPGDQRPQEAPRAVIVSASVSENLFPNGDALGGLIELNFFGSYRTLEVIGVAGDARLSALETDPGYAIYLPFYQFATRSFGFALGTEGPLASLASQVREAVRRVDPEIPVEGIAALEDDIAESISDRRLITLSLTIYAVLPLLLAGIGLYGVIASYVAQRKHEIGIRMALGADSGSVGVLVLGRAVRLVLIGVAGGVPVALGVSHLMRSQLFGVGPQDPANLLGVMLFVTSVAASACAAPIWHAVRSDPRQALGGL